MCFLAGLGLWLGFLQGSRAGTRFAQSEETIPLSSRQEASIFLAILRCGILPNLTGLIFKEFVDKCNEYGASRAALACTWN